MGDYANYVEFNKNKIIIQLYTCTRLLYKAFLYPTLKLVCPA
jgi:hypothetical protein